MSPVRWFGALDPPGADGQLSLEPGLVSRCAERSLLRIAIHPTDRRSHGFGRR